MSALPPWLDRRAYPFSSHELSLRAGRVHYVDEGVGPLVLFVHGTPTWSFDYRHLIAALSSSFRCVALDHLGFGLSERPAAFAYTPEAHADVLTEFVEQLDLRDVTLVVHDFGGPIALPLALTHPTRVKRIVLINTWMWPFDDDKEMVRKARIAGGSVGRWMYRHLNFSLKVLMPSAYGQRSRLTPAIHRQYLEIFRDKDARVQVLHALAKALLGSSAFYQALLARVDRLGALPVLIVWGMKDSAFPPSILDRWKTLLPRAQVVALSDAGHWPHEEAAADVIAALRSWVGATDR